MSLRDVGVDLWGHLVAPGQITCGGDRSGHFGSGGHVRFAGSDEGGRRAAAIYTLIETAKLNDVDPQAWLTDILTRLQDHPAKRIGELLPWNWKRKRLQHAAA